VVQATEALPELSSFTRCWACDARVGWVRLPWGKWILVDPNPQPLGEFALLRPGDRVIPLRDRPGLEQVDAKYGGPRFFAHERLCPVPTLRTARYLTRGYLRRRPARTHDARTCEGASSASLANAPSAEPDLDRVGYDHALWFFGTGNSP
jgi:hypothetical protein